VSYQEIGSGGVVNAGEISNIVSTVPSNTRVLLQLDLTASPAAWIVNQIQNTLANAGVPGVKVSTGSPVLNISWIHDPITAPVNPVGKIALDPLTAIAIIVAAVAAVAIVVIGWRMYEEVPSALQPALLIGGLILAGGLVYAYIKSKEA